MISYRAVKKLLGETSLERKCRFLFGCGVMLLITGSFVLYARMTSSLVDKQFVASAEITGDRILREKHIEHFGEIAESENSNDAANAREQLQVLSEVLNEELPELGRPDYSWEIVDLRRERPRDEQEWGAYDEFQNNVDRVIRIQDDPNQETQNLVYYGAYRASQGCLRCHEKSTIDGRRLARGDLLAMVEVRFPLAATQRDKNWNNAILLTTAIVTAFLATLTAYAIVRYVIVKPVLHLKDVSDEIARGNLELRADIHTGDEFEELSHAFNRMLRYMMNVQDELRQLNTELDSRVDDLAQVNLRLYETNKLKDEFLATMSHELRTPLNSILGFSDILSGARNLDDRQTRYVDNIQTSGRGLMVLINDLLDLAKIESGKMGLQLSEFPIDEMAERQANTMLPLAEKKNIELSWHVDAGIPIMLQDSGKMRQILTNLLSNAIKFTPEGGRVRLIVRLRDRDTVEIVVEDTGIGIPLHEQDTIFEKFRQGNRVPGQEDAITREYEGTGLGLSIVRELSKLLGGEVQLESEFGKGSTFIVSLPIRVPVDLREAEPPGIDHIAEEFVGMNRIASHEYDSPVEPPVESDTDINESDPEPRADDSAA